MGMQFVMNSKPDGYTIGTAPVELSMIEALSLIHISPFEESPHNCYNEI